MSAPQVDIIVKLRRNADTLNQAGHFAQAAATMREAADEIEALREKLDDARQIADHWQHMWSESA